MSDDRLRWVQYNHGEVDARPHPPVESARTRRRGEWEAARRGTISDAGRLVRSVLESRSRLSALQRELLQVLGEEGGAELLDQVTAVGVKRGVLQIGTGDGVALYDLRLRWEQRLLRAVKQRLPQIGVRAIRFALTKKGGDDVPER